MLDRLLRTPYGSLLSTLAGPLHRRSIALLLGTLLGAVLLVWTNSLRDASSLLPEWSSLLQGDPLRTEACYPYHEPGFMTMNYAVHSLSEYTSIDGRCPAKNRLLWSLLNHETPLSLHNRHVLLIGDSIDRALADFFGSCPGAQALTRVDVNLQDSGAKQVPRSYTFPEVNLTISSFFMYGLDEKDIWHDSPFERPLLWYERLRVLAEMWEGKTPDLIITQSGLWDLAAYTHPDETPSDHLDTFDKGLHPSFAGPWLDRAEHFIRTIQNTFPGTRLYWRTIHLAAAPYRYFGAKANAVDPLRITQMREMQLAITQKLGVPIMPVHALVDHQLLVMMDQIHLSPLGNAVYAEMTLAALDALYAIEL